MLLRVMHIIEIMLLFIIGTTLFIIFVLACRLLLIMHIDKIVDKGRAHIFSELGDLLAETLVQFIFEPFVPRVLRLQFCYLTLLQTS